MYGSGDRTDKGIVAVLSGYPAQPTTSIVKTPVKASKLPMISKVLAAKGYSTSFYYGGELEFANMKAYLLGGDFEKYTSKNDFDSKDQNSKWGAHDGVVMQRVVDGLNKETSPFFCTWLTLSSHEPFEIPVPPVLKGTDDVSLFLSSLHYTDQVVYDFIEQCKKQPWWANTLVVITADHGHRLPRTEKKINDFKIPVLFLGGALRQQGIINERVGSQTDIPATVLAQLNLPVKDFAWSRNLFDPAAPQWAYFCFNNGYGFVQPGNYFIFDNVGKKPIETGGALSAADTAKGKAIQQLSFEDYLGK
jgi:phosphoglycerol transferase MdoB-like AlkP superfamily enzyme